MAAALPQLGRGVLVGRRGPPCGGGDLTPRKRPLLWRRPVPERGSPVNRGNRPPCDNGEGEEWPSPLPTTDFFPHASVPDNDGTIIRRFPHQGHDELIVRREG